MGALILASTSYGRIIFAIGGNEESARLMGLPADRTKVIAYTTSGSLAGVLLLSILQNLINQVGTLGSYAQQLVSGFFLIVVVVRRPT